MRRGALVSAGPHATMGGMEKKKKYHAGASAKPSPSRPRAHAAQSKAPHAASGRFRTSTKRGAAKAAGSNASPAHRIPRLRIKGARRVPKPPRRPRNRSSASAHSARRSGLFCPIDGRCGGCELLRIPYKKQLRAKQAQMEELFADLLDDRAQVHAIAGMRDPRYYRNKVVSPYVAVYDRRSRKRRVLCGMYERGTHRVIDSKECLIENQEAKRIILTVRDLMGNFGMTPYDEDADTGFFVMCRCALAIRRARSWSRSSRAKRRFPRRGRLCAL